MGAYFLPASYFERLVWYFLKTRIFGGTRLFLRRETIILTISMIIILALEAFYGFKSIFIPISALFLIIIGIIMKNRLLSALHTSLFSALILGVFILDYYNIIAPYRGALSDILLTQYILLLVILAWFIFNAVTTIIQLAEFFASTAGLYILWGSDKKRIFLSPLPQIALGLFFLASIYFITRNLYEKAIIIFLVAIVMSLTIYGVFRNSGRIVRSSLALYVFFSAYLMIGYVYGWGTGQNVIMWIVITLFTTFFIAQGRAISIAKEKEGINGIIVLLIGFLLLIGHILLPVGGSKISIDINTWWLLSVMATILAPIVFTIYAYVTKRIDYYIKRDNTPLSLLIVEMTGILGTIIVKELSKILIGKIEGVLKTIMRSDENEKEDK